MDYPLTLTHVLERAAKLYPDREIVSRTGDVTQRGNYRDFHRRVHALAHTLARLGVRRGERVGTLCWNTSRHLELYFAVPCYGAVLHTLNLRLPADQLAFIINHAEDRVIFVDASLLPLLDAIRDQLLGVRHFVTLSDLEPGTEALELFSWPQLDENAAAATCYTSGTTGNPKGVVYSHRALVLHSFALCLADSFAISERDTVLQIVPMFHANGWGVPYAAIMTGARIVLPGRQLQPEDIAGLIEDEHVTFSFGVPTIWMSLYAYLETNPCDVSSLRMVVCAGSAMPRQFLERYARKYGIEFRLAWGMTETTPIATFMSSKSHLRALDDDARFDLQARHGMPLPGVDVRVLNDAGAETPWDGVTMGELQVRGPWVASAYYNDPRSDASFHDGWFRTGDVATMDAEGYIQIMDRTKDLVKSGGEWISSVDLENALMAHPMVLEAAVIAVFHPKWQERPLACVAVRPDCEGTLTREAVMEFLAERVAKWWLPDDVVFIDAVPKTSVGKFNKRALRERFKDYKLPGVD